MYGVKEECNGEKNLNFKIVAISERFFGHLVVLLAFFLLLLPLVLPESFLQRSA
jgi:hypothetical protein